jgi:hypothetical protein
MLRAEEVAQRRTGTDTQLKAETIVKCGAKLDKTSNACTITSAAYFAAGL